MRGKYPDVIELKLKLHFYDNSSTKDKVMKVQIEMSNDTLQAVLNGKRVEGSLRLQLSSMGTHREIGFKAYNRKPQAKRHDRLIKALEHGWLKESAERIKMYQSIPKVIGTGCVCRAMDRQTEEAKNALIDEVIDKWGV